MSDFYSSCAFPKPGKAKKKKLYNGFKDKAERFCYYCGTPYAERHEVYGGPNRQTSVRMGFQVDLCQKCHEEITLNTERGKRRNEYWQKFYQKQYEKKLVEDGCSLENARKAWMALIGRNYQGDIQ